MGLSAYWVDYIEMISCMQKLTLRGMNPMCLNAPCPYSLESIALHPVKILIGLIQWALLSLGPTLYR